MELNLISCSTSSDSSQLPAAMGLDLTFTVPREIEELREWKLWHGSITPLRDRLMVSKMREVLTIEKELQSIMKTINEELCKCCDGEEDSSDMMRPVVSVSISSSAEMPQVSMVYVEALYQEYKFRCPSIGNVGQVSLTVRRQHYDMEASENGELEGKAFAWQRTKLPVNLMQLFPDPMLPRFWTYLPFHVYNHIEQEFCKNPFNETLNLPYSKGVGKCTLNFKSGEMHSSSEKRVYRIRCTIVDVENFLRCRMLEDSSYRALAKKYQGAGILFYAFHPVLQEPVFLLGHHTKHKCWSDFGGSKSMREFPRGTAAKVCSKATQGVLGDAQSLLKVLTAYKENNIFKVVNESSCFVDHLVRVSYQDYPGYLQRERIASQDDQTHGEVEELKWFSLSSFRDAIKNFTVQQRVITAYPTFENGSLDMLSPCPLRYELLQTLCIAEKLNFLSFTQEICKQHHIQNPPKPESELSPGSKEAEAETEPNSTDPVKDGIRLLEEGWEAIGLQAEGATGRELAHKVPGQEAPPTTEEEREDRGEEDRKGESKEIVLDKILHYGMGAGKFK